MIQPPIVVDARDEALLFRSVERVAAYLAQAEGQRRIAEVWRTVAEDMRRENELLSGQLDAVLNKAEQLKGRLRSGIELGSKGNQPALLLDGRPQSLPPPDEKRTITCPACDATIEV